MDNYYTVGKSPFVYAGYVCNNRCIFCFEADRKFSQKTTAEIKREMKLIRENFDFINFMGQEPTLRKDIFELILYAKKLDFKNISITTNGRMFAYKNFAKNALKSGSDQIVITVMGNSAKMHDMHTLDKNSFEQTLAGIKNILLYKKLETSLVVNIMVTQKNLKQLYEIVSFFVGLGVVEINIGHIMPINKKIGSSKKMVAKMSDVVPALIKCQDKHSGVKFLFVEYPACVFPKEYRELAFPCLEENLQKTKIKLCKNCKHKTSCGGISKDYLNLYGEEEFKL